MDQLGYDTELVFVFMQPTTGWCHMLAKNLAHCGPAGATSDQVPMRAIHSSRSVGFGPSKLVKRQQGDL
jgi:hypothetical protein